MTDRIALSVVIPTYRREAVLVETVGHLLGLRPAAAEILVVDQTEVHEGATQAQLQSWADSGAIRWLRLATPSITAAMNQGLVHARQPLVLFLDDDIVPDPLLLAAHAQAHAARPGGIVAGRVIQPWQEGKDFSAPGPFHFASTRPASVHEFMGGNFSIGRELALRLGGFDENFVRVAYRFEAEFAHRCRVAGLDIRFEPGACLHHLKVASGGTRTYGEHLTTWRPDHAVGAYYHALRTRTLSEFLARPIGAVATRYHLRHPWRIPATVLAELGGMVWALALFFRGPRHVPMPAPKDAS